MRKILAFLILLASFQLINAQIVINEIMYNPPESGTDSLEYVELFNSGNQDVNLNGYSFTQGFVFSFPDFNLEAGGYVVVAIDTQALKTTMGITGAFQWESGALSNGGEDIILSDAQSNQVDIVEYQNGGDWPADGNGAGASIELCQAARDNNIGSNWKASTSARGVMINGMELRASPGGENRVSCADHTVEVRNNFFDPDTLVINVGETVEWVAIEGFHNINGEQNRYPNNPEGFGNGAAQNAPWSYSFTFNSPGDYDYHCDPHRLLGMVGYIQVIDNPVQNIMITEIMYNDPGNDTTEFLELYNNGDEAVNLMGYQFINGIDVTFGDVEMMPGDYLVVAANPSYMMDSFGVAAIGYTGAMNNGGEALELLDDQGRSVDRVVYDDASPWDVRADGQGRSLVLCDLDSDNGMGANWGASGTPTPIIIEQRQIFCSPGAANVCDKEVIEYPLYDIAVLTTIDALGLPDSNNVRCAVQGIVHGIDLQGGNSIQFTLIDQTGGMGIFSSDNFNYTVNEGDELLLKGTMTSFSGLTQMNPDSLRIISTNGSPFTPRDVTELDESTESEIVRLTDVRFVDLSRWRGDGSSFNIDVTDGNKVFNLRIDDDTDLADMSEPSLGGMSMNISGLGGQFDTSEPHLDGYQLLPRYSQDIAVILSTEQLLLEQVTIQPNPASERIAIQGMTPGMEVRVVDVLGNQVGIPQNGQVINCELWKPGMYFVWIELGDQQRMLKVVKK